MNQHATEPSYIAEDDPEAQTMNALSSLNVASEEIERYGVHPDQFIEWYGPEDGAPVVFIHGGYFHEDGTLAYLRPAALALGEAGYRVALPEYRRRKGLPEVSFEDMYTLARHPKLHDAVWVGHSAGAAFALFMLFSENSGVKHAVVLSPIADLARAAEEDEGKYLHNPTALWLGGLPSKVPDVYGTWEPIGLYAQIGEAGFKREGLRLDIIHGALDQTVPVARTRDLLSEPFNIAIVPNENHSDPIRPGSDSWLLLLGALG